ncbi:uncharacterized protein RJT20DRAFT_137550 [Scheffersomyces xylosifermentans]|uniref:uncharacterized protein n=1 Tax=Scheffersomyces xylosifermentans TaxID=1304137 RepID=UPI00315C5496
MNTGVNKGSAVSPQQRPSSHQLTPAQIQQARQQQQLQHQQHQQQHPQHLHQTPQLNQAQLQQARARPNAQNYQFLTSSQDILRKYARYPASLTLHIFETHYRFNNSQDSNIIPKNSPMIKDFLQNVMREQIPVEMSELLKDFSVKSYDGCLILQVFDHRNMVPTGPVNPYRAASTNNEAAKQENSKDGSNGSSTTASGSNGSGTTTSAAPSTVSKPKTYRTLLRPTQLSLYYDLLYYTDAALTKFTDSLSLQMESEILTLTNRKLDLSVPLNPYLCDDYLQPEPEYPQKVWDEKIQDYRLIHSHRDAVDRPVRKIHQDEMVLHKTSEYEEIMLLLSNKYKRNDEAQEKKLIVVGPSPLVSSTTTTSSSNNTAKPTSKEGTTSSDTKGKKSDKSTPSMPSAPVAPQSTTRSTGQFMRLRLIEEIRKKREAEKVQQEAKLQAQAHAAQQSDAAAAAAAVTVANQTVSNEKRKLAEMEAQRQSQQQPAPGIGPNQQAQQSQPALKKVKKEPIKPGNTPNNAAQIPTNPTPPVAQQQYKRPPTVNSGPNVAQPNTLPAAGQAIRNGNVSAQQQQQQQQQPQGVPQSTPSVGGQHAGQSSAGQQQGQQGQSQPTLQQRQQQQIFQNSLSPEEQNVFRQLQSRMNAFAVMGNTGVAPNRQQLTPQQQQQALQQAKLISQQLQQKFPVYFQSLRQFQLIQQQKQQKQKQLQERQMQAAAAASSSSTSGQQFNQQHSNVAGKAIPGQQTAAQIAADKKKRTYKKKG